MKSLKGKGKTNWGKLRAKRKSVAPASDKQREDAHKFWADANVVIPEGKTRMTVRFDTDIVDWFKSKGPKYQTRMNMVLRQFMEKQNPEMPSSAQQSLYVSESNSLGINAHDVSAAEYLRALNCLAEISMQQGDVKKAGRYFESKLSNNMAQLKNELNALKKRMDKLDTKSKRTSK